ncbi:MAG: ferrous iron transport protein A [Kordia sp.]|nr:MAG: ferrous iron transport protein A [Kordia sp.]
MQTLDTLKKGDKAIITSFIVDDIPLKLIEMGCIEGSFVELIQKAPLKDPLYLNVNGTYLSIRKETASQILVEKV